MRNANMRNTNLINYIFTSILPVSRLIQSRLSVPPQSTGKKILDGDVNGCHKYNGVRIVKRESCPLLLRKMRIGPLQALAVLHYELVIYRWTV